MYSCNDKEISISLVPFQVSKYSLLLYTSSEMMFSIIFTVQRGLDKGSACMSFTHVS